jgi:5-methylcytosine-specific restriction endonuclease McrA
MAERKDIKRRRQVEAESSLPYSFKYKIRNAFIGKKCPVCGCSMTVHTDRDIGYAYYGHMPSIQHNIPISKGGKHELGNISVICRTCNVSIQNNETGELNAKEVIEIWQMLNG